MSWGHPTEKDDPTALVTISFRLSEGPGAGGGESQSSGRRNVIVGGTRRFTLLVLAVIGGAGTVVYALARHVAEERFWLNQNNVLPFMFAPLMLVMVAYELSRSDPGDTRRWATLAWLAVTVSVLTLDVSLYVLQDNAWTQRHKVLVAHTPEVLAAYPGSAGVAWDSKYQPDFGSRNDVTFYQNNNSCVVPYSTPDAGETVTFGTPRCTPLGR